jgi:hypothetical protein
MLPGGWFIADPPAETFKRSFPERELVMAPVVIRGIAPGYNTLSFLFAARHNGFLVSVVNCDGQQSSKRNSKT